jgi:hypothetical protein
LRNVGVEFRLSGENFVYSVEESGAAVVQVGIGVQYRRRCSLRGARNSKDESMKLDEVASDDKDKHPPGATVR